MAPLTKRLRSVGVEVDDQNPDFVRKQEEGKAHLAHRFESLFAKYENMPEERSDIVDMKTGEIVQDRGHLRSVEMSRQRGTAFDLLDDLLGEGLPSRPAEFQEEDSADELAPPEPARPPKRTGDAGAVREHEARIQEPVAQEASMPQPIAPTTPATQLPVPHNLGTSQTDNITITMAQLSTLVTGLVQTEVTRQLQVTSPPNALPTPPQVFTPVTGSILMPPTDPKWQYPLLPKDSPCSAVHQLSPSIPISDHVRKRRRISTETGRSSQGKRMSVRVEIMKPMANISAIESGTRSSIMKRDQLDLQNTEEMNVDMNIQEQRQHRGMRKYHFSEDDDVYIMEQRITHNKKWPQIKDGRAEWKNWPLSALHNRWNLHLRDRTEGVMREIDVRDRADSPAVEDTGPRVMETASVDETGILGAASMPLSEPEPGDPAQDNIETEDSPARQCQLPTPSSSEYLGSTDVPKNAHSLDPMGMEVEKTSAVYDEEEMELLSMRDPEECQQSYEIDGEWVQHEDQDTEHAKDIQEKDEDQGDEQAVEIPVTPEVDLERDIEEEDVEEARDDSPAKMDHHLESSVPLEDIIVPSIEADLADVFDIEEDHDEPDPFTETPAHRIEVTIPYRPRTPSAALSKQNPRSHPPKFQDSAKPQDPVSVPSKQTRANARRTTIVRDSEMYSDDELDLIADHSVANTPLQPSTAVRPGPSDHHTSTAAADDDGDADELTITTPQLQTKPEPRTPALNLLFLSTPLPSSAPSRLSALSGSHSKGTATPKSEIRKRRSRARKSWGKTPASGMKRGMTDYKAEVRQHRIQMVLKKEKARVKTEETGSVRVEQDISEDELV